MMTVVQGKNNIKGEKKPSSSLTQLLSESAANTADIHIRAYSSSRQDGVSDRPLLELCT